MSQLYHCVKPIASPERGDANAVALTGLLHDAYQTAEKFCDEANAGAVRLVFQSDVLGYR